MRGELADQWRAYMVPEAETAWNQLSSPGTVEKLRGVLETLSSAKKGGSAGGAKSKL